MATVRELVVKMGIEVNETQLKKLDQTIGDAKKNINGFGESLRNLSASVTASGRRLTTFATLPILGLGAAMFKIAADAEETAGKFNIVFASVSEAANAASRNLVDNFGLASDQAKKLLGDTGDLLTGFSFTGAQALSLSQDVQQLAVDLASFTNIEGGATRASRALTKALLGERESVKELGIVILEEDVKARVKQLEAAGRFTNESLRQKKAIATLTIAVEQSKNAIGDFARTSGSTANQAKLLGRDVRELAIEFGKVLIPAGRRVIAMLRDITKKFRELSTDQKQQIVNFALITATIGPLLLVLGLLLNTFVSFAKVTAIIVALTTAMQQLGKASLLAQLKAFAIPAGTIAAITLAAAILLLFVEDLVRFIKGDRSLLGAVVTWISASFKDPITDAINFVKDAFRDFFDFVAPQAVKTQKALDDLIESQVAAGIVTKQAAMEAIAGGREVERTGVFGAPAPIFAPPVTAGAANTLTVNAPITVEVPPGTTPEQADIIAQSLSIAIQSTFGDILQQANDSFAEGQ